MIFKEAVVFQTGIFPCVKGYTAKEAIMKIAPDGKVIGEFTLGVGDGSVRFPTMWVLVTVWEKLAEEVLNVLDRKGIAVEASGMLLVRQYEGKRGTGVMIELKSVCEVKVYGRDGELVKVLSSVRAE
jgi:single-stranded DNA-binding protein